MTDSDDEDYDQRRQTILQCTYAIAYAAGAASLFYALPLYKKNSLPYISPHRHRLGL